MSEEHYYVAAEMYERRMVELCNNDNNNNNNRLLLRVAFQRRHQSARVRDTVLHHLSPNIHCRSSSSSSRRVMTEKIATRCCDVVMGQRHVRLQLYFSSQTITIYTTDFTDHVAVHGWYRAIRSVRCVCLCVPIITSESKK